jgi:hypothetical protein
MLDGHHHHRLFTWRSKCGKNIAGPYSSKAKTKTHVGIITDKSEGNKKIG